MVGVEVIRDGMSQVPTRDRFSSLAPLIPRQGDTDGDGMGSDEIRAAFEAVLRELDGTPHSGRSFMRLAAEDNSRDQLFEDDWDGMGFDDGNGDFDPFCPPPSHWDFTKDLSGQEFPVSTHPSQSSNDPKPFDWSTPEDHEQP